MECKKTARAIIEINNNEKRSIISIKRTKYKDGIVDRIYYTFPGGHVENGETYEDTIIREIKEELDVQVEIKEVFTNLFNMDLNRKEVFFICECKSGKVKPGNGPEWVNPNKYKYGDYEIVYIEVDRLQNYNLLPIEVKDMLIQHYK